MEDRSHTTGIFTLLLVICIFITGAVLKFTASVILPVVIAIMLSFVFYPIISTLNRKFHIPTIVGIIIVILIMFAALFFIGTLLFSSVKAILASYPKYEERFLEIYKTLAALFDLSYDSDYGLFTNLWNQIGIRNAIQSATLTLSNGLVGFGKTFTVIMLFMVFLLSETALFKEKALYALGKKSPGKILYIVKDIIIQVTRYISVKFFISLLTGVLVFLGSSVVKLDFPIIWGFLAFILNFIPNFGSIISGILTTFFAVIQFWPRLGPAAWIGFVMLAVNMVLGNFIEPKVQGRSLGLSPFVIIVSLSIWGWLWGFIGMILAVPMMVILKITCENVEMLRPISILMGSKIPNPPNEQEKNDTKEKDS